MSENVNLRKFELDDLIDYIEKNKLKDKIDMFIIRRLKQYRLNIIDFNINSEIKSDPNTDEIINRITSIVGEIDHKDPYDTDDYEDIYLDLNGSDDENDENSE